MVILNTEQSVIQQKPGETTRAFSLQHDDEFLGRAKQTEASTDVGPYIPFPVPVLEDLLPIDRDAEDKSLLSRPTIVAKLISSSRALVDDPKQATYLRNRGFYGYIPCEQFSKPAHAHESERSFSSEEESDEVMCGGRSPDLGSNRPESTEKVTNEHVQMILTDVEILFLMHGLGCLQIVLPEQTFSADDDEKMIVNNSLRLWYYICSGASTSEPFLHPTQTRVTDPKFREMELDFLRRYAAYLYYRSRGWIVRPGLALGGMHFLLYANGPAWRHAAFGVVVDRTDNVSRQLTCASIAAHVRVAHSVGKRLILCRVSLPDLTDFESFPWNAVRQAKIQETLIDHWTPAGRKT
ncbi:unnamed protein product [Dicrocoelium dendriticum]|nr:unnamed protein product [Dicrocoelium dendriticum]